MARFKRKPLNFFRDTCALSAKLVVRTKRGCLKMPMFPKTFTTSVFLLGIVPFLRNIIRMPVVIFGRKYTTSRKRAPVFPHFV